MLLFYFACFWISFFLCIPLGPVNLEVFHAALQKKRTQALLVGLGGAVGDSVWAMTALLGVTPFMNSQGLEIVFILITAVVTFVLGLSALRDAKFTGKKEPAMMEKIKQSHWAFLKGLTMVLINPLGTVSWLICLQFLKRIPIFIPMQPRYEIIFALVVTGGAFVYFALVVVITDRMKNFFNPERTRKVTRGLGLLLIALSAYFVYHAIKVWFFKTTVLAIK